MRRTQGSLKRTSLNRQFLGQVAGGRVGPGRAGSPIAFFYKDQTSEPLRGNDATTMLGQRPGRAGRASKNGPCLKITTPSCVRKKWYVWESNPRPLGFKATDIPLSWKGYLKTLFPCTLLVKAELSAHFKEGPKNFDRSCQHELR